jgi:hypothetical protein
MIYFQLLITYTSKNMISDNNEKHYKYICPRQHINILRDITWSILYLFKKNTSGVINLIFNKKP